MKIKSAFVIENYIYRFIYERILKSLTVKWKCSMNLKRAEVMQNMMKSYEGKFREKFVLEIRRKDSFDLK